MELRYDGRKFYWKGKYEERNIPKGAGLKWDPVAKIWWTCNLDAALKLEGYADIDAREALQRAQAAAAEALRGSAATDADIDIPVNEGLAYLPFQKAGIAWLRDHRNALMADEMGLGKTIQALGAINVLSPDRVLIVCPASLKLNWKIECKRWLVRDYRIGIVNRDAFDDGDIIIVNYDILPKHPRILGSVWDMVIVDEAHYVKNPKAKRSQSIYRIKATRKICLTGTPILNRPIELQPILFYLNVEFAMDFRKYAMRYCNPSRNAYGWDFRGASHLDELQERARTTVMIRRLKKDVLNELPEKRREAMVLAVDKKLRVQIEKERNFISESGDELAELGRMTEAEKDAASYGAVVERLADFKRATFDQMARLRHETALRKVPIAVENIVDAVRAAGKVIVFAHHHDVIDTLAKALKAEEIATVTVTGKTAVEARQAAVEAFQNDEAIQVFLGSIQACGFGITLTAASTVIFVELDWVPATMTQAEDRAHRMGQKNSVLVRYVVVDGSIDSYLAKMLLEKQAIIGQALDGPVGTEPVGLEEMIRSMTTAAAGPVHGKKTDGPQRENEAGMDAPQCTVGYPRIQEGVNAK